MAGQVKSVKPCLKQLQQSIQTIMQPSWPTDESEYLLLQGLFGKYKLNFHSETGVQLFQYRHISPHSNSPSFVPAIITWKIIKGLRWNVHSQRAGRKILSILTSSLRFFWPRFFPLPIPKDIPKKNLSHLRHVTCYFLWWGVFNPISNPQTGGPPLIDYLLFLTQSIHIYGYI